VPASQPAQTVQLTLVPDAQQSFPLWHKNDPSQSFYIHEVNSVSIHGVKHAPL
jgi:hypothetical protein